MSRWGIDPPDDDAYDVRYDGTDCADCGGPSVAWLCETCSDQREAWAAATEMRIWQPAVADTQHSVAWALDVALVPVFPNGYTHVVEVALVPVVKQSGHIGDLRSGVQSIAAADGRFLKRMAKAILSADLTTIKEVA